ncbi:MAG: hypothetical protein FJ278_23570, partial [Planctomycetes bacterium]|nr:hypothetical protein [Planctomycetota bacterium]
HPKLGDFELVAELGFGAMGTAYRARRVSTNETVALRILPFEVDKDKAFLDRLARRTHAAGKLKHPQIAEDWHLAQAEGFHLIVAELMEGGSLRARIRKEQKLPEHEAIRIAAQVAEALDYLHRFHLFHGAVKPSNILLTADKVAKLADVGLVRSYDVSSEHAKSPLESFVYSSPDQYDEPKREQDIRTDIYQLGTTLYHALCGTPPFVAQTPVQLMARHLQIAPPSPKEHAPELSDATCRMLLKMLEKDPAKRHQTPADLLKDLRQVLPPEMAVTGQPDARVKRRQLLTLVGACCLAAAISGFSVWHFLIAPKGKAAAQKPAEPPAPDLAPQKRDKPFEAAIARVAAHEPPATPDALLVAADGSGKFKTIQAALDAAKPGDVVRVKAGTYRESVKL